MLESVFKGPRASEPEAQADAARAEPAEIPHLHRRLVAQHREVQHHLGFAQAGAHRIAEQRSALGRRNAPRSSISTAVIS